MVFMVIYHKAAENRFGYEVRPQEGVFSEAREGVSCGALLSDC